MNKLFEDETKKENVGATRYPKQKRVVDLDFDDEFSVPEYKTPGGRNIIVRDERDLNALKEIISPLVEQLKQNDKRLNDLDRKISLYNYNVIGQQRKPEEMIAEWRGRIGEKVNETHRIIKENSEDSLPKRLNEFHKAVREQNAFQARELAIKIIPQQEDLNATYWDLLRIFNEYAKYLEKKVMEDKTINKSRGVSSVIDDDMPDEV